MLSETFLGHHYSSACDYAMLWLSEMPLMFGIHWASQICGFKAFVKLDKFLAYLSHNKLFAPTHCPGLPVTHMFVYVMLPHSVWARCSLLQCFLYHARLSMGLWLQAGWPLHPQYIIPSLPLPHSFHLSYVGPASCPDVPSFPSSLR